MDDCENKVGSELWLSRHLAGKGEEDGRRKLSEVAGMLGSMLQRGVFATALGKEKVGCIAQWCLGRGNDFQGSCTDPAVGLADHQWSRQQYESTSYWPVVLGWVEPWIAIMRSVVTHLLP